MHHTLRNEVIQHLGINYPVDRVEYEDFASHQSTFELVNEVVIPRGSVISAILVLIRWLCGVHFAFVHHSDPQGLECMRKYRSLRWPDDIEPLSKNHNAESDAENEKG